MYAEMFGGLHEDPRRHLRKFFTEKCDEVVLVRDISFNSMCEHHMLPFMGKAHVAYLPGGRVVGLSKLARVVEAVARRPQVQERMTEQIADLLVEELHAKGVAVVIEAIHTCMTIRGVRKPGSLCVTSAMKGVFRTGSSTRAELMTLIYGNHSLAASWTPSINSVRESRTTCADWSRARFVATKSPCNFTRPTRAFTRSSRWPWCGRGGRRTRRPACNTPRKSTSPSTPAAPAAARPANRSARDW